MDRGSSIDVLEEERRMIEQRIDQDAKRLAAIEVVVRSLREQLERDRRTLREIDSVLGRLPQLDLRDLDIRLRGQHLEEVALKVLAEKLGDEVEVHYRDWFALLEGQGLLVAGKEPLNTFLAQINRSPHVERIGKRTGRYRVTVKAA
ncbi:MAG: hypothetical protein J0H98_01875 [Solirubrobacterales bacterium]|nr:hypothetical protein [Solirubrobacterales bacterium]